MTHERANAGETDPLFVVRYRTKGGEWSERRMSDHRIWKLVKAIGKPSHRIQTTTRYTRLTQTEMKDVVGVFDRD